MRHHKTRRTRTLGLVLENLEGRALLSSVAHAVPGAAREAQVGPIHAAGGPRARRQVAFIDKLYTNVLGREADAEGTRFWLRELRSGASRKQVRAAFRVAGETGLAPVLTAANRRSGLPNANLASLLVGSGNPLGAAVPSRGVSGSLNGLTGIVTGGGRFQDAADLTSLGQTGRTPAIVVNLPISGTSAGTGTPITGTGIGTGIPITGTGTGTGVGTPVTGTGNGTVIGTGSGAVIGVPGTPSGVTGIGGTNRPTPVAGTGTTVGIPVAPTGTGTGAGTPITGTGTGTGILGGLPVAVGGTGDGTGTPITGTGTGTGIPINGTGLGTIGGVPVIGFPQSGVGIGDGTGTPITGTGTGIGIPLPTTGAGTPITGTGTGIGIPTTGPQDGTGTPITGTGTGVGLGF